MFPYPSGAGLHIGHTLGYTQSDIIARFKNFNNFNVLQPMGWDAFGLPAEQFAIKNNKMPQAFNITNINNFRNQLKSMGFAYDYDKEVDTSDPKFYQWTQWIFLQMYKKGLASIKEVEINWCEKLGTALANEDIIEVDGHMVSEVGKFPVVKKPMKQWVLKITDYADKLLDGLKNLEWEDYLKHMQINWIGKSHGTILKFKTTANVDLEVYTTRIDTIYGVSYLAIAPENELVSKLTDSTKAKQVNDYIAKSLAKSDLQRKDLLKDKTGLFTGAYAINPITNQQIPIYVADYVLNSYATGIVMGVPAHDQRDYDFAIKYKLPINYVIECKEKGKAYEEDGKHINSPLINGLNIADAAKKLNDYVVKNKLGKATTQYKFRDWIFSRQRYWGEPFPILFDKDNKIILDEKLPVTLPNISKITVTGTGEGPLANVKNWINVTKNGKQYHRDSNTMPQWAGSSWYFIAYLLKQPNGSYIPLNSPKAKAILKKWLPVDFYDGGMEHAVSHLLYSRFWHRFLYDIKVVSCPEPFTRLINHGLVLGHDGNKMSKSLGNVINPTDITKSHGADALRLYEIFMGPVGGTYPWNDDGIDGIRKWLDRVYRLFFEMENIEFVNNEKDVDKQWIVSYHSFIKSVTENIETYKFNIAISDMMVFINSCYTQKKLLTSYMKNFVIVLSCFCPHLAEEINAIKFKSKKTIYNEAWPKYEKKYLTVSTLNIPVQECGKLRSVITIKVGASQDEIMKIIKADAKCQAFLANKQIVKVIYIKDKIVNLITK